MIRRLLHNQSDLSVCSVLFYLAGGLFSLLILTVFRTGPSPSDPLVILITIVSPLIAVMFFISGRRVNRALALGLVCAAGIVVLGSVFVSPIEIRTMNSGLLFYTFIIYLVWFGPMWLMRTYGYLWLAVYCTVMVVRFGIDVGPFLVTLSVTAALLGELIGRYKGKLDAATLTDALCGVWNKRAFDEAVTKAVTTAHRNGLPLTLVYCDLDNFKAVNDLQGHAAGDQVLRDYARGIEDRVRSQDTFFRLGGDEFALLMPDTDSAAAHLVGARLQSEVSLVGWSFGAAELQPYETAESLTARADTMMLERKRRRKAQQSPHPQRSRKAQR